MFLGSSKIEKIVKNSKIFWAVRKYIKTWDFSPKKANKNVTKISWIKGYGHLPQLSVLLLLFSLL